MPELPEVETYKRIIETTCLMKRIIRIEISNTKILQQISPNIIIKQLFNNMILKVDRHGKYLFLKTKSNQWLVLHFGMTGYVTYFNSKEESSSHIRLLVEFENGYHLAYHNQRLFGKIWLINNKGYFIKKLHIGQDALQMTVDNFSDIIRNHKMMIKSLLMNQSLIAGIGNIYADEILFQSNVHPKTLCHRLSKTKRRNIYHNMIDILQTAIDARADFSLYPVSFLIPYREKNGMCPKDGRPLQAIKINGRTSYFCLNHQKLK